MCPGIAKAELPDPADQSGTTTDLDAARRQPLVRELVRLVEHSIWANRLWIEYVYAQSDSEARPRELLVHLVVSERVWFERIAGGQKTREMPPAMEKTELLRDLDENRRTYLSLIATRLEDVTDFKRGTGEEYHARVVDIIHHLLTHGYHHRGQLAAHFARRSVSYPNTDHINYLIANKL